MFEGKGGGHSWSDIPKAEIDPFAVDMSTHQGLEIELISRLFRPGNNDCV